MAVAGGFLRSRPVHNTIQLVALDSLRARGPPCLRRRRAAVRLVAGHGRPVTAALLHTPPLPVLLTRLLANAAHVVLFTDLANPTSNGLYRRLGYQPVEDRVVLRFEAPG